MRMRSLTQQLVTDRAAYVTCDRKATRASKAEAISRAHAYIIIIIPSTHQKGMHDVCSVAQTALAICLKDL
jgi:hypothetical protein